MNGTLPDYYISTADAKELGWNGEDNLHVAANGKQIGGDHFYDYGKKLPYVVGRIWYEADINYKEGVRNKHRIVYSNDGLVFVTYDLYETFFEIVGVAGNKKANPQTGDSALYSNLQDAKDDYGGEASLLDIVKKAREMGGGSTGGGTSGTSGTKGPNPNTDDSEEYVYWSDSYNVNYRTKPVVGNAGKVYYYTQYYSFITGWRYFDIYDYNPQQMSQSKGSGETPISASDDLIAFLKSYEKFYDMPYIGLDSQNRTVGYGHVIIESDGSKYDNGITEAAAIELLKSDLKSVVYDYLNPWIKNNSIVLTQQQYDALVSFTFNAGPDWITRYDDLRNILTSGNITYEDMHTEFMDWTKVNNVPALGLYRRRMDELNIFFNGDYSRNYPDWT